MDATTIRTARLVLTPLRPADADAMLDVLADRRLHEFIGEEPLGLVELRRRYERLAAGSGYPDEVWLNWIVRLAPDGDADGAPVGTVQATVTNAGEGWVASLAWIVGVPWQGHGYAGEAASALVRWLAGRGVRTVRASIHPGNVASAGVAARAGLVPTEDVVDGERVWTHAPNSSISE